MLKIESAEKYSIAEELKIKEGDILQSINGQDISDILDYIFFDGQDDLDIVIKKKGGKTVTYEISKDAGEPLGLSFGEGGEIESTGCVNNCLFCFVDQLPKNLRETLYFKDDDYRLSFVSGNYVTLTNISENEIKRIIDRKLSPLYVSVHTTDTALRKKMLGNPEAEDIMKILTRLSAAGIETHCQIVLCGSLNDGEVLKDTTRNLHSLYPAVQSLAVVPVGLTRHREGLHPLSPLTGAEAGSAIDFCEEFNREKKHNFVFCSDEMYLRAGRMLPEYSYYGEFLQIENGVGLIRKFEREFLDALDDAPAKKLSGEETILVTGESAAEFLGRLLEKFREKFPDAKISAVPVKNSFFGESVTVSGLVTGRDIIATLKKLPRPQKVIIPRCMLKEFSIIFLDDTEYSDIGRALGMRTEICAVDGAALLEKLLK